MKSSERGKATKRASLVALMCNSILAALKIVAALFTNSMALLADGVDTATDILTSLITYLASRISESPPDREHPYGHVKIEALASNMVALVMFASGLGIFLNAVGRLVRGEVHHIFGLPAIIMAAISVVGKLGIFTYEYKVGKREGSSVLIADAMNMRNDILISSSVLAGLIFYILFNVSYVDTVMALFISVLIVWSAIRIVYETSFELMDGVKKDCDIYERILEAVNRVEGVHNPHKVRARKSGNVFFVDLDVEVDPDISVEEAHMLARKVERSIKRANPAVVDVVVHVEPLGNPEKEAYGISAEDITEKEGK